MTVETRLAVVIASLVGLILLALLVRQERRLRKQRGRLELPPLPKRKKKVVAAPPVPEVQVSELYPDLPAEHVLARCPMVDMLGESSPLRDWLRHFAGVDAWPLVVERFYERAAHEPLITDYFRDVDMNKLQRHFLAALMIVTGQGVTVGVVRRMHTAHTTVLNSKQEPITAEVWDATIGILAEVLGELGTPPATLVALATTIAPIRSVIVVDSVAAS